MKKHVGPLMLRVKANSEMDLMLRALMDSDVPLTEEEVVGITGLQRSGRLARRLNQWFDNVSVTSERGDADRHMRLNYVNVFPTAPTAVTSERVVEKSVAADAQAEDELLEDIRWPMAPPIMESIGDVFREPSWFGTMATMVKAGSHISLAGPPGVGKDTAVQELAAQEGKVLVTVGGDAGFRRRDLVGSLQISKGRSFLEVAEYAAAVVNGWWVLLSEVNAADADALMFINTQLAAPYIINIAGKSYPVHKDFRLFITYNPGLVGTKPLPQSFKDRFFSIEIPFFSEYQLRKILESHGMPVLENTVSDLLEIQTPWTDKVVQYGMKMWDAHVRGQLRYQITSRRLMDAVRLMNLNAVSDVKAALELSVLAAIDSPVEKNTAKQILGQVFGG